MNHNRQPLSSKARKKTAKEIKKGQALFTLTEKGPTTDQITPRQILKKYPPKIRKGKATILNELKKKLESPKKKKIPSKRTTPGELLTRDSPPKSIHVEGTRWEKTLDMQNKIQRKRLKANLLKRQRKK